MRGAARASSGFISFLGDNATKLLESTEPPSSPSVDMHWERACVGALLDIRYRMYLSRRRQYEKVKRAIRCAYTISSGNIRRDSHILFSLRSKNCFQPHPLFLLMY
jgi:hypothetical protein